MPARPILALLLLALGLPANAQDSGYTPDWTVGDWWEVELRDLQPFCVAAHVCPPEGHPRSRTFLFLVVDRTATAIETKVVEGRDLTTDSSILATFRASDRSLARLRGFGRFAFDTTHPSGRPVVDPTGGREVDRDFPALLFLLPLFPLEAPPAPPAADQVERILADLGSDEWAVRAAAVERLERFGPAVAGALRPHLDHPDPEVRYRLRSLVERFRPEAAGEGFQSVEEAAPGVYEVRLGDGRTLTWRAGEPWWSEAALGEGRGPGPLGIGSPGSSARLVARRGDPGVEPPPVAEAAAAEAYGRFLSGTGAGERRRLAEDFLGRFRDSSYASRVALELATLLEAAGERDAALELLDGARFLAPGPPSARAAIERRLGDLLAGRGRAEEAAAAYDRVLTLHEAHGADWDVQTEARRALAGRAALARTGGDEASALRFLERLVAVGSKADRIEALSTAAGIHAAAGRHAQAERALATALAEAPAEAAVEDLRYRLAEAILAQGRRDEAVRILGGIRTAGSEWTAKARERLDSPASAGLGILASHYPQGRVVRGRATAEARPIRLVAAGDRAFVHWGPGPGLATRYEWTGDGPRELAPGDAAPEPEPRDWDRRYEARLAFGAHEVVAPERFNRGVTLRGDVSADLDGDGRAERILTLLYAGYEEHVKGEPRHYDGEVHVLPGDGGEARRLSIGRPATAALLLDVDGDGRTEIVLGLLPGERSGSVVFLSPALERVLEVETATPVRRLLPLPGPGPRLVAVGEEEVLVLDGNGRRVWREAARGAVATVADLDGDGGAEVVFGQAEGTIEVRRPEGQLVARIEGLGAIQDVLAIPGPGRTRRLLVGSVGLHLVGYDR